MEFATECYMSFTEAEDIFKLGLRGKPLKEIPLWIKALMVDEGLMPFQNPVMEA